MHDRDAYREDREAELGYAEVSERELRLRDWEITRGVSVRRTAPRRRQTLAATRSGFSAAQRSGSSSSMRRAGQPAAIFASTSRR